MPRRDYSSKKSHSYQAPRKLVHRNKLKSEIIKKRVSIFITSIVLCGFILSVFYWLFFSSVFRLTNIIFEDENGPSTHAVLLQKVSEILKDRIFLVLPRSSFFLFSPEQAAKTLHSFLDYKPPIEDITIQAQFPHTIKIGFHHKISRLKVVVQTMIDSEVLASSFLVDSHGSIIADGSGDEGDALSVAHIITKTPEQFSFGKKILEQNVVSSTLTLYALFKSGSTTLPHIDYIEFSGDDFTQGAAHMREGFIVYVSFKYPLQEQLNNLLLTLENIKHDKNRLTYIDLRIENRAYACCNLGVKEGN